MISVGSVTLSVTSFGGWNYPSFGNVVAILSDGSSTGNEVLQSAAVPRMRATLAGKMYSYADVQAMHAYNASKETVTFIEADEAVSDGGEYRSVNVLDFSVDRSSPGNDLFWTYSLTLIEAE